MSDLPAAGRIVAGAHRYPVRVHWEDTDRSGAVYHANYLRFMERARSEMLRCAGIDQAGAIADGEGAYAVADLAIRYRRPALFDDALTVVSRLHRAHGAACAMRQTVMRGAETLADADVTVAFLGRDGRPRRQPLAWIAAFRRLQGDISLQ